MNKIATSMIICGMAIVSFADPVQEEENTPEEEQTTVNVYDMTISAKVPYLKSGIRAYSSQKMSGHMYLVYDEDDILSDIYAVVTNAKTKVVHKLSLNGGSFYNLIGKQTKKADRSTPTVFFNGGDSETIALRDEAHEEIIAVALAGTGSIKSLKNVTSGCGYCGEDFSVTEYCNILWAMNGSVTGVMDCQCPDDEDWWHTVETVRCGVYYADIDATKMSEVTSPSHYASFYGTWTAKFNKKLSDTKVK